MERTINNTLSTSKRTRSMMIDGLEADVALDIDALHHKKALAAALLSLLTEYRKFIAYVPNL
jgi:hypothetical protein